MSIIRNILVRVGADSRPLDKGLNSAKKSLGNFSASQKKALYGINANLKQLMSGTGKASAGMGASLGIATAAVASMAVAAAAAFAVIGKQAITAAMDVNESENLFTVSMGNMADSARAWSEELQASLGLNGYEVRKNVGLFYNMTTSMGLARSEAYKVSTGITKLAYDMSSFYNQSPEEMFTKLQAGLTGEVEPLKRLGIIVNETTTKNWAYANGIANVGAELSEVQKVMGRYGVIMDSTKNAQGDLARTITSPSNQLRILQMQLKLAQINLGQAFMPIVTIVLPILTNFAKSLVAVTNTFKTFMSALFGTKDAQQQSASTATQAAKAQTQLGTATKKAGDKASKGVAGFDEINQLQESIATSADDAASAMEDVAATTPTPEKSAGGQDAGVSDMISKIESVKQSLNTLVPDSIKNATFNAIDGIKLSLEGLSSSITNFSSGAWNTFKNGFFEYLKSDNYSKTIKNIGETIANIGNASVGAIGSFKGLTDIFDTVITKTEPELSSGISKLIGGITNIGTTTVEVATNVAKDGFDVINNAINQNSDHFTNILTPAFKIAGDAMGIVGDIFSGVADTMKKAYDDNIGPLKDLFLDVFGSMITLLDKLLNSWIYPLVIPAFEALKTTITPAFDVIKESVSKSIGAVIEILKILWESYLKPIVDWCITNLIPVLAPLFTEIGKIIGDSFGSAIMIVSKFFKVISDVLTFVKDVFKGDWEAAWGDVKNIFKAVWESLVDIARIPINSIIRMVNKLFEKLAEIKIAIPTIDLGPLGKFGGGMVGFPRIPNIPEIPALANGGIVTAPTLAQIGEAGKEAVIPLENSSFIDMMASKIGSAVLSAMQFNQPQNASGGGDVIVQIDSTKLARIMIPAIGREQGRIGNAIIQGI